MKTYTIPELRITVQAENDEEFERKKKRLLERHVKHTTGGRSGKPELIKDLNF